jgi:hypothetical protein
MVSDCVGCVRKFAQTFGPSRSQPALFVREVSSFFHWSTDPATARLRGLSGVFQRCLTSRAIEGNHLFWRFAGQAPRVAIANRASSRPLES